MAAMPPVYPSNPQGACRRDANSLLSHQELQMYIQSEWGVRMARTTERAADLREPVGFEWDEAKRRLVLLQRGIDFIDAAKILTGPVLEYRSDLGTEGRFVAIGGPSRGALIAIV